MKKTSLVVGFFLLALFQTLSAQEIGRYQLLNAVVEVGGQKESVLFKIDTVTGNTWRYNQLMLTTTNGVPLGCDGWNTIGDYAKNYDRLTKSLGTESPKTNENKNSVSLPDSTRPK